VNYKKGCTRLAAAVQVIKFTSCLPMVGGSLRVLRLPFELRLLITTLVSSKLFFLKVSRHLHMVGFFNGLFEHDQYNHSSKALDNMLDWLIDFWCSVTITVSHLYSDTSCQYVVGARVAQWVRSLDLTTHTSLSPIRRGFAPGFVNYKKGCTRLAAAVQVITCWIDWLIFGVLTPLSTIFQLYHGDQF
jgi:hypothetical protein